MFAQTSAHHTPNGPFIIVSRVESTNNYAMAKLHAGLVVPHTCFLALEQTAGKGQRGKQWVVNPGENITMSTVFGLSSADSAHYNSKILSFPFLLSASISLGCYDFIKALGVTHVFIKWPNDVYIGDRKAAGILIENIYKGQTWEWAVAGTGINLNQSEFHFVDKKAISVKMSTGKDHDVVSSGKLLHQHLINRFEWLQRSSIEQVMHEYNSLLYKKGEEVKLKKENIVFTTRITSVTPDGELHTSDTLERRFRVGEVEFINV